MAADKWMTFMFKKWEFGKGKERPDNYIHQLIGKKCKLCQINTATKKLHKNKYKTNEAQKQFAEYTREYE